MAKAKANTATLSGMEEIEAYLQGQVQSAPEPGPRSGAVVDHGTEETPFPLVNDVESAGYSYVYDRKTGLPSLVNNNLITGPNSLLGWRDKQGSPFYTLKDPGYRPQIGPLKCRLHPEDADREKRDRFGLVTCTKEGIHNEWGLRRHMQLKHKDQWLVIQEDESQRKEEEIAARRDEDRQFQRMLMERLIGEKSDA